MWNSAGRSGYGESTVQGNYDSWDGLSRNGRQYKNEATMETRDLSGADYWHLRKQNRPTEEIPASLHMIGDKANLDAYAEPEKPRKKLSVSIQDKILPQAKRVTTLTNQMKDLVAEYQAGNIDIDEYSMLLSIVSAKRERSLQLLEKAKSVRAPFESLEDCEGSHTERNENKPNCLGKTHVKSDKRARTNKRTAIDGNRFKHTKKPKKDDSNFLSKTLTFLAKNDWAVFIGSSIVLFTTAKIIF